MENDYVAVTAEGLLHSEVIKGYFIRRASGPWVLIAARRSGKWRLVRGYNMQPTTGGTAKERAAAVSFAVKKMARIRHAQELQGDREAATMRRAEKRDWAHLQKSVVKTAEKLVPIKDVVSCDTKTSFTALAKKLSKVREDLNKQRHPEKDWENIIENIAAEADTLLQRSKHCSR